MGAGSATRRAARLFLRLISGLALLSAGYLAAALIGSLWTDAPAFQDTGDKTHIVFILSNGYHTDIALAVDDGEPPAGLPVSERDFPGGFENVRYLLFGWGSEAAYTTLGSIADLSVATAFKALAFDKSVVHVLPLFGRPRGEGVHQLDLSERQYGKLVAFIAQTFATDEAGGGDVISGASQGFGDIFYLARPRFSPIYTCNVWTGQALRAAGVRMGRWTPFVQSVEWSLTSGPM